MKKAKDIVARRVLCLDEVKEYCKLDPHKAQYVKYLPLGFLYTVEFPYFSKTHYRIHVYDFNHQGRVRERWWDTNFFWFPLEDHTIDNISLVIYPVYPVFGTKFACISCIL